MSAAQTDDEPTVHTPERLRKASTGALSATLSDSTCTPAGSSPLTEGPSPWSRADEVQGRPSAGSAVANASRRIDLRAVEEGGVRSGQARDLADVLLEAPVADQGEVGAGPESKERVYWQGFFVVCAFFCGYASLFGLQHFIKARFGIKDNSSSASHQFGVATSCLYIFNLIFRFAHNVLFAPFSPRGRVYIAVSCMMLAMLTIGVMIMLLESYHLGWVVLAYSLGGTAVGTFESNLLSCLTPLGHETKHIAICGIPVGVTFVLVGVFLTMGPPFNVPVTAIYFCVACINMMSLFLFMFCIPSVTTAAGVEVKGQLGLKKFVDDCKQFRKWLPQLWHYPFAMTVDMFALSCFSPGVALFIYNGATVDVLPGRLVMPTDTFFALYNTTNMLGGVLGRWLSYRLKHRHPVCYTIFTFVGVALLLSRVPALAPLSTFFVMLGDGLIYGTVSRHVDNHVPKEFNLTAISYWLFVGDFGSVVGSNLISYVRDWVMGS